MFWRLFKTTLFTLVAPGTVGVYAPQWFKGTGVAPFALRIAGWAFFACGAAAYLWCAWDFVTKGLGTPLPIDAPRVLVVKGLYKYTRNPMYVGVLSMVLGQALFYGSRSIAFFGLAVLCAFYLFVLLYEEPVLRQLFGDQYEQYCRKVPRWLFLFRRA